MKTVTIGFANNNYIRRDEEKIEIRVASGSSQPLVNQAFETAVIIANKFANDLAKAGFKGATLDTAYMVPSYGRLAVEILVRIPTDNKDKTYSVIQKMLKPFEAWANEDDKTS